MWSLVLRSSRIFWIHLGGSDEVGVIIWVNCGFVWFFCDLSSFNNELRLNKGDENEVASLNHIGFSTILARCSLNH
jgi:hypothetical protein